MRPGLVAMGVVFLALATAGVVGLYLIPIPSASTQNSITVVWTAAPFSSNTSELRDTSASGGSVDIHWQSTLPLTVQIYTSHGCEPGVNGCPAWQLALNVTGRSSGDFAPSGGGQFPYLFTWANPGSAGGSVSVTTTVSTTAEPGLSPLSQLLLALGVVALGFVGAIALFLGLFLRRGVYQGPAPLVSRDADDAASIAAGERPPPPH